MDKISGEKYLKTTIGRKMLKTMLRNTLGENIIKKQTMSLSLLLKWLI